MNDDFEKGFFAGMAVSALLLVLGVALAFVKIL